MTRKTSTNPKLVLAGELKGITYNGKIMIQGNRVLKIGSYIYLEDGKKVGKIIKVFGNAKKPYIEIEPLKGMKTEELVRGEEKRLYISTSGDEKWQRKK